MRPMDEAPRDGTRFLCKVQVMHFKGWAHGGGWQKDGTKVIEAWYREEGENFIEWCGNERVSSTNTLHPLGWLPMPEEFNTPAVVSDAKDMFGPSPGQPVAQAAEEDRIDRLRLAAFKSNDPRDRQAYFDAASKWFQERHYRRPATAPDREADAWQYRLKDGPWCPVKVTVDRFKELHAPEISAGQMTIRPLYAEWEAAVRKAIARTVHGTQPLRSSGRHKE